MKIAINQWSFPGTMRIREQMAMAKANGYDGYEPALSEEGELSLQSSDSEVREIAEQAKEIGIALVSLASGLTWGCSPTANCAETRAKARSQLRRQLECASLLGVDGILHVPGTVGYGFWDGEPVEYDACWERALENLSAVKGYAAELGVKIGIENVWNNFLMSPIEMRTFIDAVDSPFVGAYLDVGNVIRYGMPETWVRLLGKRIVKVHVKDYRRSVGTLDGFVDLLSGDVNYPAVMRELEKAGFDGYLTAEMNMGGGDAYPGDVVYRTARALEKIVGRR